MTAQGKRIGDPCTSRPSAHHQYARGTLLNALAPQPGAQGCAGHLAFSSEAWNALHEKTCCRQVAPDLARTAPGGCRCTGPGNANQLPEQFPGPHGGVAGRRKPIKEEGVNVCFYLAGHMLHTTKGKRKR